MQKQKVLFLITKSNWGGAQRYVHDLATNLDLTEFEPVVALGGDGELKEKLEAAEIKTISLPKMHNTQSPKKLLKIISEVREILEAEQPDVLHTNSSIAGLAGVIAGRKEKINKIVFTAHGWTFNEDRSRLQKLFFKTFHWLTVLLSHTTIAVSHEIKNQLTLPFINNRWVVIHNGRTPIEFETKEVARKELHIPNNTGLISGTIGELHPVKQHDMMIKAVAQLRDAGVDLTHIIIGAGDELETLQTLTQKHDVSDRIIYTGAIHEAARYLKAFDIYIQPSRSEALAYTVIEATQAGLPIIATKVGGIPEIISHEQNGLLVPNDSVEKLVDALQTLINNQKLANRYGQAALETSSKFSFSTMLKKTSALYRTDSSTTASSS